MDKFKLTNGLYDLSTGAVARMSREEAWREAIEAAAKVADREAPWSNAAEKIRNLECPE